MVGIYGIEDYIDRAKEFIAAGDENSLRHAALELRFCIERIVYQKLAQLGPSLPPAIVRTWQPPTAIKMLKAFEGKADIDKALFIKLNQKDPEATKVGEYKMFSMSWLRAYHKLGSFLHAQSLSEPKKTVDLDKIQEIFREIERVASADMIVSITRINTFKCSACGGDMYASQEQIDASALIECPNSSCGNKHLVRSIGPEEYAVEPSNLFMFACTECQSRIAVESYEENDNKICWNCGKRYKFGWAVWPVENDPKI